jgi:SAM-dependent methyltransferase
MRKAAEGSWQRHRRTRNGKEVLSKMLWNGGTREGAQDKGGDFWLLRPYLPARSSRQACSLAEAQRFLDLNRSAHSPYRILDLGCGAGNSLAPLRKDQTGVQWFGLDIADSLEVRNRRVTSPPLCTYDGMQIPMQSDSIDLVYSRQVFEHVRHPEQLLSEVFRIIRPGGFFLGSTSHLEPFHSRSYWNYTPYGFAILLQSAGFDGIEVRPGIDGLTLISRRLFSYLRLSWMFESFFVEESPLNSIIESLRILNVAPTRRNALKLYFCGHFVFRAKRKESVPKNPTESH